MFQGHTREGGLQCLESCDGPSQQSPVYAPGGRDIVNSNNICNNGMRWGARFSISNSNIFNGMK